MLTLLSVNFWQSCLDYCKRNPVLAGIAAALVVAILAVLIAIPCVSSRRKKNRLEQQTKPQTPPAEEPETATETEPVAQTVVETETKSEPTPSCHTERDSAAAERSVSSPEPVTETVAETQPIAEPVTETKPETVAETETKSEPVPEQKPQPKAQPVQKATAETKPQPAAETASQPAPQPVVEPTLETKPQPVPETEQNPQSKPRKTAEEIKQKRYAGKWVVFRVVSDDTDPENGEELYFFELHASNGEKLLSSEEYTSYNGAIRGIETHKKNILADNFRVTPSKKGHYIFKLLNGKSTLLCTGENYPTKLQCERAVESTKRFAETAVLDENVQELFIHLPPEEETPDAALPEGCVGKWIISSATGDEGETVYFFELFANNGEKLLASEEYTSYIGAVNGIETHKKNIVAGNLRITLTKRGDYIYKLLNRNGQLLCLGEHYRTRRLCQNAVESVKRFALSSPVLTSASTKNQE